MVAVVQSVLQDHDRLVDMADNNVGFAVVVQVAKGRAPAHVARLEEWSSFCRDIFKTDFKGFVSRLAQVPQQHGRLQKPIRLVGKMNHVTVGDEDVLGAVPVEIDEPGAEADVFQANGGDAGGPAGKDELAAAKVSIQTVSFMFVIRDEQ